MSINITQGETKIFTIAVRDQDGDPFDLTNFDEYKACLPLTAGGNLEVTEVANANGSVVVLLGSAILGKLQVTVNYVDTLLLSPTDDQDIGILLNNNATPNPKPRLSEGVLNVEPAVC